MSRFNYHRYQLPMFPNASEVRALCELGGEEIMSMKLFDSGGHGKKSAHELVSKSSKRGKQSPRKVIGPPSVSHVLASEEVVQDSSIRGLEVHPISFDPR